jgi:beta-lactamase superfamily II metal-dependent hydrolase
MNRRKVILVVICILSLSVSSCSWLNWKTPSHVAPTPIPTVVYNLSELQVYFIDVGQGDAILIDFGLEEILIDANKKDGLNSFLADHVNGDLECVVVTHPHADHISGLSGVLGVFKVDNVWTNGVSSTSQTYSDFMTAVSGSGAQTHIARRGDIISVGNYTLSILNPPSTLFDDTNNDSIVIKLVYGGITFLFMGDSGIVAEENMINAGLLSDINVLKVGHHASDTSTSTSFLNIIKPEVAVYTAGIGNTYGHPDADTINKLISVNASVYGTDKNGTIEICTDGNSITHVYTEK